MKNKVLQKKDTVSALKFKELNMSDMDILRGGGREKLKGTDIAS